MAKKSKDEKSLVINNHHAYAVLGSAVSVKKKIFEIVQEKLGVKTEGNPDFFYEQFESLSVDDARRIKNLAENKSFENEGKKVFVLDALSITREAQNSLLKILEEPNDKTYFFIFGNCVESLIPTVLSRVSVFDLRDENLNDSNEAEKFLKLPLSKRLTFVKKMSEDIKDEKTSRAVAVNFIADLEKNVYEKFKLTPEVLAKKLEYIEICRDYLNDRSASIKMILEFLAIVLPQA